MLKANLRYAVMMTFYNLQLAWYHLQLFRVRAQIYVLSH